MENDFRSRFPQTRLPSLFPNRNFSGFGFDKGHPNIWPGFRNPLSVEDFSSTSVPFVAVSATRQLQASEPNNSTDWFYHTPHPHQAFVPVLNSSDNDLSQRSGPKRFLVFDQSGDKTTMMLTSGPVRCGTFGVPNIRLPFDSNKEKPSTDDFDRLSPVMDDKDTKDDSKNITEDEMCEEDTEELNALLFSDSEDYSEDNDEEASTGHSPSTMTNNYVMDLSDEAGEEVDSFARPTKRQKLSNGDRLKTSNCHGKGSFNETYACSALDEDAESSCGDGNKLNMQKLGSVSCGKRSRKGKLLKTVSVLQNIIPGSNEKDTLAVIDEAIHYLKTLKAKAKALGLDPL